MAAVSLATSRLASSSGVLATSILTRDRLDAIAFEAENWGTEFFYELLTEMAGDDLLAVRVLEGEVPRSSPVRQSEVADDARLLVASSERPTFYRRA